MKSICLFENLLSSHGVKLHHSKVTTASLLSFHENFNFYQASGKPIGKFWMDLTFDLIFFLWNTKVNVCKKTQKNHRGKKQAPTELGMKTTAILTTSFWSAPQSDCSFLFYKINRPSSQKVSENCWRGLINVIDLSRIVDRLFFVPIWSLFWSVESTVPWLASRSGVAACTSCWKSFLLNPRESLTCTVSDKNSLVSFRLDLCERSSGYISHAFLFSIFTQTLWWCFSVGCVMQLIGKERTELGFGDLLIWLHVLRWINQRPRLRSEGFGVQFSRVINRNKRASTMTKNKSIS